MTLMQGTAPPSPPTPCEVKEGIVDNEQLTASTLAFVRSRLDDHEHLRMRLVHLNGQVLTLGAKRSLWQAVKDAMHGERHSRVKAEKILLAGQTIEQKARAIHSTLRSVGYGEIEDRTKDHYNDLKRLTLLDINGDPEATEFRQRSTEAIFQLRAVQREVESLVATSGEMLVLEEGTRGICGVSYVW